ncbi:MAG TPA: AAA family ATPase, partial [Thermoanaerobaculia bacterium]|nr:AAA family ATPase [Thermoanaerobaculia bacterium]
MDMSSPAIRSITIRRFRGIELMKWRPAKGLNMIVGPADGGKSTILEAISLLFSQAPNTGVSEFDYFERDLNQGFTIEAVLAIGNEKIFKDEGFPQPPLGGWLNGRRVDLPDEGGAEAVLVCRVSGTPDSDLVYEIVGPGDEARAPFSRALRGRIGVARLESLKLKSRCILVKFAMKRYKLPFPSVVCWVGVIGKERRVRYPCSDSDRYGGPPINRQNLGCSAPRFM